MSEIEENIKEGHEMEKACGFCSKRNREEQKLEGEGSSRKSFEGEISVCAGRQHPGEKETMMQEKGEE